MSDNTVELYQKKVLELDVERRAFEKYMAADRMATYWSTWKARAELVEEAAKVSAPLPGVFARTVGTRVARRMLQMLLDNRVPVSVEYVCSDVTISVPFTYATVLDKTREAAERDLQEGLFAPCQPMAPGADQ